MTLPAFSPSPSPSVSYARTSSTLLTAATTCIAPVLPRSFLRRRRKRRATGINSWFQTSHCRTDSSAFPPHPRYAITRAAMLSIENLTYRIAGRLLLERTSLSIPSGHHAGLVGRNGTGKSTLLKLIAGELHADSGEISLPNNTRIGMVAQEAPDGPESLIDTVLKADRERTALLAEAEHTTDHHRIAEVHTRLADIEAHRAPARADSILHGLGFDAEQQLRACRDFSGGWRMRVALAAVLFSEPDLLLLDEPTNHLDLEARSEEHTSELQSLRHL